MRILLLCCLMLLALGTSALIVFGLVSERQEAILLAVLPLILFIPLLWVYLWTTASTALRSRHQGMANAARQLGCSYSETASPSLHSAVAGFALIESDTHISDEIIGERDGVTIRVFTCLRIDSSGNRPRHHYYTVALLPDELQEIPSFSLAPENMWERLQQAAGDEDLDFEGSQDAEAFSRHYSLRSHANLNGPEIRRFFDREVLAYFANRRCICLQVVGQSLMVWHRPSFGKELVRGCRSVQTNVTADANEVVQQALEILEVFRKRNDRR